MQAAENLPEKPARQNLRRYQRILKGPQFRAVFASGKRIGHPQIKLVVCPNDFEWSRLGLAVSKGVSKKAVVRNRLKRQLREIFRLAGDNIPRKLDIVVIPQRAVLELNYHQLQVLMYRQVQTYCKRAGILRARR